MTETPHDAAIAAAVSARDACYRAARLIGCLPDSGWFGAEHDAVRGVADRINDWIEERLKEPRP